MPSFNTEGKSKEDLAIVAQLAGLLTLDQTSSMSRTEIARVIDRENRKLEAAANTALQGSTGVGRPTRGRKPKVRIPAVSDIPAAAETQSSATIESPVVKVKKPATRTRRKATASAAAEIPAAAEHIAEVATDAVTSESVSIAADAPAIDLPVAPKTAKPRQTRRTSGPGKTKKTKTDTPALAEQVEIAEIPAVTVEPVVTEPAPIEKPRKKPGRKPSGRRKTDQMDNQDVLEPRLDVPADAAPVVSAVADAQPAEAVNEPDLSADRSPEAAEAAADHDIIPHAAHHVPPRHTLAPTRPGQRRTRIIGNPGSTRQTDRPAAGRPDQQKTTRQGKTVRTIKPADQFDADSAAAEASESEYGTAAETSTATILPLPTAHDQEQTAAHRPVVEAGDVQSGVLEIMPDGYGFLRKENYLQGSKDIYVPPQYIRRFGLRMGDHVSGPVKLQRENDRYQALLYIKEVNGQAPEKMIRRPHFDRLTPIYPDDRFVLETVRNELSTRIIDLVAPIGKGQRGMIVSPPKAGKTILLQKIANAISINNPEVKLIVLLIDERPEEVTDMQRSINGEVVYSTFDKTPENHTKVTELVLERAMRLVELKQDVVILLDSMTRLARAYNLSINPTGRTLSGGLDPGALYGPKRFFGAARNIENGGSLTIIATSLIETGSRMDEVIFEEFKGTGNMEVYLDRKMSEKRIFPAIDINKSGTRREELLMSSKELDAVWTIRKAFGQLDTTSVTEAIINLLLKTTNNQHFISSVNVSFNDKNVFEAMRGVKPSDGGQSGQSGSGGRSGGYGGYNSSGHASNYRRMNANDDD